MYRGPADSYTYPQIHTKKCDAGQEKVSAISGALESAMINGLITNEFTAEALMKR